MAGARRRGGRCAVVEIVVACHLRVFHVLHKSEFVGKVRYSRDFIDGWWCGVRWKLHARCLVMGLMMVWHDDRFPCLRCGGASEAAKHFLSE